MEQTEKITKLKLLSVHSEAGNVRTFVFETGGLHWTAGQSQGYILSAVGEREEENQRWFTIASAPSEGTIHISTRVSDSAFKQALNDMKPGEEIETYGLDGDFVWQEDTPVVLVAGGIGVTPFRSMLVERAATGKSIPATLLYFNRTAEIPFISEFEHIVQKHPEFVIKTIVGEPITAEKIMELAPEATRHPLYLSGPEPMVEAIGSQLRARGVSVRQDRFPGYDEHTY